MKMRPVAVIALAVLVGCGGDTASPTDAVVTDSSGVRVVVNPPTAPEVWRLSEAEVLEIGVEEGASEYEFFQVRSGEILADGTIVVVDGATRELRYYDSEGRHLRSVGGEGEGPGEFRSPVLAGVFPPDSLLVWDGRLQRASVFSSDGTYVRSFTLGSTEGLVRPGIHRTLSDRTLVIRDQRPGSSEPGIHRPLVDILLGSPDGTVGDLLDAGPGPEMYVPDLDQGTVMVEVLFGRDFHFSAGADRVALANDDAYSVRVYNSDGELLQVVRQDREPVPVGDEDFDRAVGARLEGRPEGFREVLEQAFRRMPRHETLPAFASIKLDEARNLWVQEHPRHDDEPPVWQIFGPDGILIARVETPHRFQILEIGDRHVLGVHRDEQDVEFLRLYRLQKEGS